LVLFLCVFVGAIFIQLGRICGQSAQLTARKVNCEATGTVYVYFMHVFSSLALSLLYSWLLAASTVDSNIQTSQGKPLDKTPALCYLLLLHLPFVNCLPERKLIPSPNTGDEICA